MPEKDEVSDEILEHIAEVIGETTAQIDCNHQEQMVDIDQETPETIPLTPRIMDRYTELHSVFYRETTAE